MLAPLWFPPFLLLPRHPSDPSSAPHYWLNGGTGRSQPPAQAIIGRIGATTPTKRPRLHASDQKNIDSATTEPMTLLMRFFRYTESKIVGITSMANRSIAFVDYDAAAPVLKAVGAAYHGANDLKPRFKNSPKVFWRQRACRGGGAGALAYRGLQRWTTGWLCCGRRVSAQPHRASGGRGDRGGGGDTGGYRR
jgi:hypothetical protein